MNCFGMLVNELEDAARQTETDDGAHSDFREHVEAVFKVFVLDFFFFDFHIIAFGAAIELILYVGP